MNYFQTSQQLVRQEFDSGDEGATRLTCSGAETRARVLPVGARQPLRLPIRGAGCALGFRSKSHCPPSTGSEFYSVATLNGFEASESALGFLHIEMFSPQL